MRHNNKIWFEAILNNDIFSIKEWISKTENIDATDVEQCTPLYWSCFLNKKEITKLLLENGANPFIQDEKGIFPWYISMSRNNDDDWDLWYDIYPIFNRIKNTYYVINLLSGILGSLIRNDNWRAIEAVFNYQDPKTIKGIYYSKEGSINNIFIPFSHLSYSLNKKNFILLLMKYDYDLDSVDNEGNTALDLVLCDKNDEWKNFLISIGAEKYKKELK